MGVSDWGLPDLIDWVAPKGGTSGLDRLGCPRRGDFRCWRERADAVAASQADSIEPRVGFRVFGGGRVFELMLRGKFFFVSRCLPSTTL